MNNSQKSSKLVLLLLVVMALIPLSFLFFQKDQVFNTPYSEIPVPTQSTQAQKGLVLKIQPSGKTVSKGDTLSVTVESKSNLPILAIDTYFSYDAKNMSLQNITAGDLFEEPMIFSKKINQDEGTIFFAFGSPKPSALQGTLVTLVFKAANPTQSAFVRLSPQTLASLKGAIKADITISTAEGIYKITE